VGIEHAPWRLNFERLTGFAFHFVPILAISGHNP
jgi:hypothetical protein